MRLRMVPVSLKRWLQRRPWLMAVLRELKAYRFHADDLNASSRFRRNHMGHSATPPTQEPGGRMSPFDAFERICYEVIELEALANAANAAIDECAPPSESRRSFDRAQALIGNAAEKATAAVALIDELKTAVKAYASDRR